MEVVPVFFGGKGLSEVFVFVDSFVLVFSETLFDHVESQKVFILLGLDNHETFFDLSQLFNVFRNISILYINFAF